MFDMVYEIVKSIPRGKVMTYGDVAVAVGKPRSARFVGFALHQNPDPHTTPCHRVVFRDGSLSKGYAFGGEFVQRLKLESEGVFFINGKVDLDRCRINS